MTLPSWGKSRAALVVAYAVYVPLVAAMVWLSRYELNPDGVAYLRIAGYYAQGKFDLAVVADWPPLLSWLMVPWYLAGVDPLLGARVVSALAGGVFIGAVHTLARRFGIDGPMALAVTIGAGLLAAGWVSLAVSPDVLLAAVMTTYFVRSRMTWQSLRGRDAALAGVLAGIASLAKSFALPFFIVHHSLTTLFMARQEESRWPGRRQAVCWLAGMGCCFLLVAPWATILSLKYGRPTFSTSGRHALEYASKEALLPVGAERTGLSIPRPGRLFSGECRDEVTAGEADQRVEDRFPPVVTRLKAILANAREAVRGVFQADGLGLMYIALVAVPFLACIPRGNVLGIDPRPWRWSLAGVGPYVLGLVIVYAGSPRYFWPIQGLLLSVVGTGAIAIGTLVAGAMAPVRWYRSRRFAGAVLAGIVIAACALGGVDVAKRPLSGKGRSLHRIAAQLADRGVAGLVAASHGDGLIIAYHLSTPFLGVPAGAPAEDLARRLREAHVSTFLLFDKETGPLQASGISALPSGFCPATATVTEGDVRVSVYMIEPADNRAGTRASNP